MAFEILTARQILYYFLAYIERKGRTQVIFNPQRQSLDSNTPTEHGE